MGWTGLVDGPPKLRQSTRGRIALEVSICSGDGDGIWTPDECASSQRYIHVTVAGILAHHVIWCGMQELMQQQPPTLNQQATTKPRTQSLPAVPTAAAAAAAGRGSSFHKVDSDKVITFDHSRLPTVQARSHPSMNRWYARMPPLTRTPAAPARRRAMSGPSAAGARRRGNLTGRTGAARTWMQFKHIHIRRSQCSWYAAPGHLCDGTLPKASISRSTTTIPTPNQGV
jgi:hypothetical protein